MRVLLLSTYPASATDSGGVLRLRALNAQLGADGHETHVLAVVTPDVEATPTGPGETTLRIARQHFSQDDVHAPGYHDMLTGLRCLRDEALVAYAEKLVATMKPDIVLIEQPFLIGLAERLCAVRGCPLVYSAANLEAALKRDLVALVPQFYRHPEDLLALVQEAERRAVRRAALTIAIAPGMVPTLREWGAVRTAVFGNGTRAAAASAAAPGSSEVKAMLAQSHRVCFGCFGSAYWPNVEGVAAVLWPSLAFLSPDARLVSTGQLNLDIRAHRSYQRGAAINDSRMIGLGHLAAGDFHQLVGACDALLLPVFVGSGSPLKSADALATGRPVLMSRAMAAGYEEIIAACPDGVTIVDDPAAFRLAWKEWAGLGKSGLAALAGAGRDRARLLAWPTRLGGLSRAIAAAARPNGD